MTRRNSRPCRTCSRSTKSTTRYCPDCRPEDATPHVTRVEGGITFARNAIGAGGISKVYEETDLGGLFVVGKIGFSRK